MEAIEAHANKEIFHGFVEKQCALNCILLFIELDTIFVFNIQAQLIFQFRWLDCYNLNLCHIIYQVGWFIPSICFNLDDQ